MDNDNCKARRNSLQIESLANLFQTPPPAFQLVNTHFTFNYLIKLNTIKNKYQDHLSSLSDDCLRNVLERLD